MPWAERYSRVTTLMAAFVIKLLEACPTTQAVCTLTWCIKENFSQFWSYSYKGAAKRFFKAWSNNAMRSRLEPVKKVVKMLRRHEEGLLNYSQHGISNACAEGFNSAIQLIKANARRFRSFTNYQARILFHCGKLNLAMA